MTKIPAIITPIEIRAMAFQYFTPNRKAIKLPVHEPEPGRGIDTKNTINTEPYWANFLRCLFLVFSKSFSKNLSNVFECLRRNFVMGPSAQRIMKFGIKFPITPIIKAFIGESPIPIPTGMANLSSVPGTIEPKKVTVSGVIRFEISMVGI